MKRSSICIAVASILALTAGLSLSPTPRASAVLVADADAGAARDWDDDGGGSHDRARHAAAAGEILPIAEIYARTHREVPGRILDAELERERGRWVYELKLLEPAGGRIDLHLDAANGQILGREKDR
jgi:uncharacterized membrane protein YkoI